MSISTVRISSIAAIKELRQIEKDVKPDVIHLHSSVAGGLGRLAYKGKNNTVVYAGHSFLKNNSRTPNPNLIQSNRKLPTGSSIFLKKAI